jgi:predicted nucleic acid-binding protein
MALVGTPKEEADDYREILIEMAEVFDGGVLTPPRTVHDCRDHEDNLVLDLAAEVGALLIVSEDADLTSMSSWRGVPVLRAREFRNPSYSNRVAQLQHTTGGLLVSVDL